MSSDLGEAKQRLLEKLGPNYGIYIQLLGKWFRGMISKDEFDRTAKQLIEQNFVLEHNKFWLAFFHHCANSASNSLQTHSYSLSDSIGQHYNLDDKQSSQSPESNGFPRCGDPRASKLFNVRCLPSKIITHMKIFVIAWEMGLDSANDHVSLYINLALQQFLKNILTEVISTKTAYRLRENRFKYALGVKPINPYLNNSLKVYSANLEYDPYQIESNKMNCSLVDTYAYNDSLFPSRLYETQALYELACSTTSVIPNKDVRYKRLKLDNTVADDQDDTVVKESLETNGLSSTNSNEKSDIEALKFRSKPETVDEPEAKAARPGESAKRLTLFHLLLAFLSNRSIIPSQSLYSINLERILMKLSC